MTARESYPLLAELERSSLDALVYPFRAELTFALDELDRLRHIRTVVERS